MLFKSDSIICTSPKQSDSLNTSNQALKSTGLSWKNSKFSDFVESPPNISSNDDKIKIVNKLESTEIDETNENKVFIKALGKKETANRYIMILSLIPNHL